MTVILNIPAGRIKRDIIELAFDDCGLAGYEFDRTPEEQNMALRKLNAMMLEWPWSQLGYAQPTYGVGRAEDASGLPDEAVNAVAQYLALRIAPGIGNTLSPEQRASMARSLQTMQAQIAVVPVMRQRANTPLGSGRRRWGRYSGGETTTAYVVIEGDAEVTD